MVRKWSYLNSLNILNSPESYKKVCLKYTFKVFRTTTRFKKYILYPTIFFRKKDSTRKRRNNWVNLNNILVTWSLNYLKIKQLYRFYQNYNVLPISRLSLNLSTVLKRSTNIDLIPWNSASLTRKFYYSTNPLLFSRKSVILTQDLSEGTNSEYLSSNLIQFDSEITPQLDLQNLKNNYSLYTVLINTQLISTLQFLVLFYKINTLSVLLNTLTK